MNASLAKLHVHEVSVRSWLPWSLSLPFVPALTQVIAQARTPPAARMGGYLTTLGGSRPHGSSPGQQWNSARRTPPLGGAPQLSSSAICHILSLLPPNERALTSRLVCRDAAKFLSAPEHCTASLSQPLPPDAAPWAVEAGQQHMQRLRFQDKMRLLTIAAKSGSEFNLELALTLVGPSVFPELLQLRERKWGWFCTPDKAAAEAGHLHLLGWLQRRCPGQLSAWVPPSVTRHCDLAGLKAAWAAWRALQDQPGGIRSSQCELDGGILYSATGSPTPDAIAKMEWLLEAGGGSLRLDADVAAAATLSGDLDRLRWLHQRGCPMDTEELLSYVLGYGNLAVVQFLVEEVGYTLPVAAADMYDADEQVFFWKGVLRAAASGPDAAAVLQWLQQQGLPQHLHGRGMLKFVVPEAVSAGRVELLRHLWSTRGVKSVSPYVKDHEAARSDSIPLMVFLRQAGRKFTIEAYHGAHSLGMVRWLALEAKVSATKVDVSKLVCGWSVLLTARRERLQAVQLLVEEAGCSGWDVGRAVHEAVLHGDMDLVQYLLRERPGYQYRPDRMAFARAAEDGCEALLEWLAGQPGSLEGPVGGAPYATAARWGDRATVTTLRRLGVPWGAEDTALKAVSMGSEVLPVRWLVEHGIPLGCWEDINRMYAAVKKAVKDSERSVAAVRYLHGIASAAAAATGGSKGSAPVGA